MKKLFVLAAVTVLFSACQQEKTAYVNSSKLFDDYAPIKSAKAQFDQQQQAAQEQMRPKMQKLQKDYQALMEKKESMGEEKFQKKSQAIQKQAQQMQKMQQMQMQELKKKREATMDSLNDAVESAVADYAEQKGYTYVFGMSDDSNQIVYASDSKNITDDVLSDLNDGKSDQSSSDEKEMKSKEEMDSTMAQ